MFYDKTNGQSLRVRHPLFGTSVFIDEQGWCWAAVNEASLTFFEEKGNDELTKIFMAAFESDENVPPIYYKLKI